MFARTTGRKSLKDLDVSDLVTINKDIAEYTGIPHAGAPFGDYGSPAPAEDKAPAKEPDKPAKKKYKCLICQAEFEAEEGSAECPICKATGDSLQEI